MNDDAENTRAGAAVCEAPQAHGQTRARAGARERRGIVIRSIRVAPGARRTPLVFVDVEHFGLRLTFAVVRLRGGALEVRPPRAPDGTGAGLWMPKAERDRIGAAILAAVGEDEYACLALRAKY